MFIQFRVRKRSIRMLLYLEGTSGLNENHTFLVGRESVAKGAERKPVASAGCTWNWTLIVLFESAYK